jgi:two-component system chemotaxis response regulator CheB
VRVRTKIGYNARAGARTVAQDEKSCAVFGMPKEAIKLGASEKEVSLGGSITRLLIAIQDFLVSLKK